MQEALNQAKKALACGEVPIGAVIVKDEKIIAKGHNRCIKDKDPSAHAEIVAIRKACKKLNNYRLNGCDIFITIEPCAMCAAALVSARVANIFYGAPDKKAGACGSVFRIANNKKLNHKIKINKAGGDFYIQCSHIIKNFFKDKRNKVNE
jgi:tRNA(adenine34) deaminase